MKTQKLSHSISKFTPSLAIALLVVFAPNTSAITSSQYTNIAECMASDCYPWNHSEQLKNGHGGAEPKTAIEGTTTMRNMQNTER